MTAALSLTQENAQDMKAGLITVILIFVFQLNVEQYLIFALVFFFKCYCKFYHNKCTLDSDC